MDKRTFMKLSGTLLTAPLFSPLSSCGDETPYLKNWAGNLTYGTNNLNQIRQESKIESTVKSLPKMKVLGTRHCFNAIADSREAFISLTELTESIHIAADGKSVTVNAGSKYGQLSPYLHQKGFALHNLASLPHISVAGACATATHGSGEKNGNLASAVLGMEIVQADGTTRTLTKGKDGDEFNAAVVHLGALGVITKVTLAIQPTFEMVQYVYQNLPISQLSTHFDEIQARGYSVSLFTNWQNTFIEEVWIKQLTSDPDALNPEKTWLGATLASQNLHPLPELSAENCTEQMGVSGPWYERLPHFKMGFTPSSGDELQSEYFVPRERAVEAIFAISRLGPQISPYLLTSEIRTIAADGLWMSPCYQQDSVAIHFTWKPDWPNVQKSLLLIEQELLPFRARPHWGKLYTMAPALIESLYPKLPQFRQLVKKFDPTGKFENDFLTKNLFNR